MLGAAIGVLGSSTAAVAAARSSRGQTRAQIAAAHRQWLLDNRRRAYHDLVSAARSFENAWWDLGNALDAERAADDEFAQIARLYPGLTAAEGGVHILGPEPVADAARALMKHLRDMDHAGTVWFHSTDAGASKLAREDFWAKLRTTGRQIEALWTAAREVLDGSAPTN